MMKQWIDMVFEHGFAFGTNGDKLKGKHLIVSMTIGGKERILYAIGI
jgi:putative NADPH-quinone reductase